MTYQNRIEIVLFQNNNPKNEKAPHATGTVEFPDGTKYEVSLWNKVSKAGNPFKSGYLKLKTDQPEQRQSRPERNGPMEIDF